MFGGYISDCTRRVVRSLTDDFALPAASVTHGAPDLEKSVRVLARGSLSRALYDERTGPDPDSNEKQAPHRLCVL